MGARRPTSVRRRRRRGIRLTLTVLVLAPLAYGLTRAVQTITGPQSACTFAASGRAYAFSPAQAQNAAIIAAAATRLDLPDHAVTVALAAALQESKLRDLTYGDRDSLGLFQQRPSQGWGTRTEILSPVYAATAFYGRLATVPRWQSLPITDAAQAVQKSADADGYARWATEAQAMAEDLTGEAPAGLTCRLSGFNGFPPPPGALAAEAAAEMGTNPLAPDPGLQAGWRNAAWMVAHAFNYHIDSVSYQDQEWTPASGRWQPVRAADPDTVTITGGS